MVDWCKKKNDIKINFYLYDFIIGFLKTEIDIDKEFKKEAICFTVKNYKLIVKDKNNQEINLMNNSLVKILIKEKNFTEKDYEIILNSIIDNNFNDLKLYLFDKLDKFKEYLELYLHKELNIAEKRDEKIYNWINNKIQMFKEKKYKYENLINTLIEHTVELALLSIDKFFELSKEVFQKHYKQIVERLK